MQMLYLIFPVHSVAEMVTAHQVARSLLLLQCSRLLRLWSREFVMCSLPTL